MILILNFNNFKVRYLQLQDIDIPPEVNSRRLLSLVRSIETEKEDYIKIEKIVRKETELVINLVKNNATELIESSKSGYKTLIEESIIDADEQKQNAHNEGDKLLKN
jgi:hypothetical protein